MSERATVQGKIGRSATTNPLDEGIDPYQSIGWTLRCTACAGARRQPRASMIMPKRAMLVQRFWRFLKFGRQRVDIDFSFVGHGTVNSRRAPEVHCAHGEIQNEHRRCSFHIVLEAAPRKPGKQMLAKGHSPPGQRYIAIESTMMFHPDHSSRKMFNSICKGIVLTCHCLS